MAKRTVYKVFTDSAVYTFAERKPAIALRDYYLSIGCRAWFEVFIND